MGVGDGPAGTVVGGTVVAGIAEVVVVDVDVVLVVDDDPGTVVVDVPALEDVGTAVVEAMEVVSVPTVDDGGRVDPGTVVGVWATPSTTDGPPQAATSRATVVHRIHTGRSSQRRARFGTTAENGRNPLPYRGFRVERTTRFEPATLTLAR